MPRPAKQAQHVPVPAMGVRCAMCAAVRPFAHRATKLELLRDGRGRAKSWVLRRVPAKSLFRPPIAVRSGSWIVAYCVNSVHCETPPKRTCPATVLHARVEQRRFGLHPAVAPEKKTAEEAQSFEGNKSGILYCVATVVQLRWQGG